MADQDGGTDTSTDSAARALRALSLRPKPRLSSLDVPMLDDAADRIDALRKQRDIAVNACRAVLAHVEDETAQRMPIWQCTLCYSYRDLLRRAVEASDVA